MFSKLTTLEDAPYWCRRKGELPPCLFLLKLKDLLSLLPRRLRKRIGWDEGTPCPGPFLAQKLVSALTPALLCLVLFAVLHVLLMS